MVAFATNLNNVADYNTYLSGAASTASDAHSLVDAASSNVAVSVDEANHAVTVSFDLPTPAFNMICPLISTTLFGTLNDGAGLENPDGSALSVDKDFFQMPRSGGPRVGPFQNVQAGHNVFTLRPNANFDWTAPAVPITPVFSRIDMTPINANVRPGSTLQFSATAMDQIGGQLSPQPASFAWSVSGGGTISSSGLFTAGSSSGGPYTVIVSSTIGDVTQQGSTLVQVGNFPINAGGQAIGGFIADRDFSGGKIFSANGSVDTNGVDNAAPSAVYLSHRFGNFSYTENGLVPGATYTVRLHFAEIYWTANGQRVFNVTVNGSAALTNFDIHAIAGANKAVVRDVAATATSAGIIVIDFTTVVDNATLAGIEVIDGDSTPPPLPGTLPAPWTSQDVGIVTPSGSASAVNEVYTITGAGTDIWNSADGFRSVTQTITGDCDLVARVNSIQNTDRWAKAGVMLRATMNADSVHAMSVATANNGMAFQNRTSTGANSNHIAGTNTSAPRWVKITRRANLFSGYESADGITWLLIGQQTITMPSSINACLVVTSHLQGTPCTAVLSQVSITPVATN